MNSCLLPTNKSSRVEGEERQRAHKYTHSFGNSPNGKGLHTHGETRAIMLMMMVVLQRVKWLLECIRMHAATHLMISPFNRHTQTIAAFAAWAPLKLSALSASVSAASVEAAGEERMQIAFRFDSSRIDSIDELVH